MTTMNRFGKLYSERKPMALLKDYEWSFDSICAFKARHRRENCVSDTALYPKA